MPVNVTQIVEPQLLTGSAATLFTASAKTNVQISKVTIANPTGTPYTYTLYVVPSGGSAGASNTITSAQSVAAGTTYNDPNVPGLVLNPGDFISGFASTTSELVIAISGVIFS